MWRALFVFDDLDLLSLATRTFKRSSIMIGPVRLDRREPHCCAAFGAFRPLESARPVIGKFR